MSARELERVEVLGRVKAGTLRLITAATMLGLSYRQAKRVWQRFCREGPTGLQHRQAGRASNHACDDGLRVQALALIRTKYGGDVATRFGPTLAAEHLASEDGLVVHAETLRRWMLAAGLWSRARQRRPYRRRRERKAHFGELVQLDGSFHRWLEDRGPAPCLITLVDDATSRSLGRFSAQESLWAAVAVLRAWITRYGVPQALYTDWKTVYVRAATEAERLAGVVPLTQFGRMCAALGIQIIPASSPQAKGRIERNHGTHQDRLVKKLRRLAVATLDDANAFLARAYWSEHNRRFARAPGAVDDMHRAAPSARQLDQVFRIETPRVVGGDWVVRYHNRWLQLERQSHYAPAQSTVTVCEWPDGHLAVVYRGQPLRWSELGSPTSRAAAAPLAPMAVPRPPRVTPATHPWKKTGGAMPRSVPLWQAIQR